MTGLDPALLDVAAPAHATGAETETVDAGALVLAPGADQGNPRKDATFMLAVFITRRTNGLFLKLLISMGIAK